MRPLFSALVIRIFDFDPLHSIASLESEPFNLREADADSIPTDRRPDLVAHVHPVVTQVPKKFQEKGAPRRVLQARISQHLGTANPRDIHRIK